jgi:molybdenum cofactor cytidylyltransferase
MQGLDVRVVRNEDWARGQSSSIKKGVQVLNSERGVGAAVFLLVDQPQVTKSILKALAEKHAEGLFPVVAPMVIDQRANPVLFDRVTFPDLMELEGYVGGRAILHKHRVEYLPWHDDRLLLDVDTPEQYQRLISDESL